MQIAGHDIETGLVILAIAVIGGAVWFGRPTDAPKVAEKKRGRSRRGKQGFRNMKSPAQRARERQQQARKRSRF